MVYFVPTIRKKIGGHIISSFKMKLKKDIGGWSLSFRIQTSANGTSQYDFKDMQKSPQQQEIIVVGVFDEQLLVIWEKQLAKVEIDHLNTFFEFDGFVGQDEKE